MKSPVPAIPVLPMAAVVVASNILVQYPVDATLGGVALADWLTWGAFTYPAAFLVTDLTNRALGPAAARRVVYAGFALAVLLSIVLATPRIAVASGTAFLVAQLLDVHVFDRLRRRRWWIPPLVSTLLGSTVDTVLFFSLAFAATGLPWMQWAIGDFAAKLVMAGAYLACFRAFMPLVRPRDAVQAAPAT